MGPKLLEDEDIERFVPSNVCFNKEDCVRKFRG
jgi:hypothetical protein